MSFTTPQTAGAVMLASNPDTKPDEQIMMDRMYLSVMVDLYVRLASALSERMAQGKFEDDDWFVGFKAAALAVHLVFRPNHADELDFFLGLADEADE